MRGARGWLSRGCTPGYVRAPRWGYGRHPVRRAGITEGAGHTFHSLGRVGHMRRPARRRPLRGAELY